MKNIFDAILGVQPKQSGAGGGETRESVVFRLADDMLSKLPPNYVFFEVDKKPDCEQLTCNLNVMHFHR